MKTASSKLRMESHPGQRNSNPPEVAHFLAGTVALSLIKVSRQHSSEAGGGEAAAGHRVLAESVLWWYKDSVTADFGLNAGKWKSKDIFWALKTFIPLIVSVFLIFFFKHPHSLRSNTNAHCCRVVSKGKKKSKVNIVCCTWYLYVHFECVFAYSQMISTVLQLIIVSRLCLFSILLHWGRKWLWWHGMMN